jgi:hypothetical protein
MAPPPVFLTRSGVFKDSVRVELAAKSGVVRYTLDGSDPTANAPEYSQPFVINRSAVIKARTFQKDHVPSPTVIETFTIADNGPAGFNSNLPLVIINSFGRYISANNKSPVSIRFINTRNGRASLLGPADYDGRASVNLRGYSTLRGQPKNSLTVRLKDESHDALGRGLRHVRGNQMPGIREARPDRLSAGRHWSAGTHRGSLEPDAYGDLHRTRRRLRKRLIERRSRHLLHRRSHALVGASERSDIDPRRGQRRHRVLENGADRLAAELRHLLVAKVQQFIAVQPDRSGHLGVLGQQADHSHGGRGFS